MYDVLFIIYNELLALAKCCGLRGLNHLGGKLLLENNELYGGNGPPLCITSHYTTPLLIIFLK